MAIAYLGLGSNLGDRARMLGMAMEHLARKGQWIVAQSLVYETEPWGLLNQPRFLNSACAIETDLPPLQLLKLCKSVEFEMHRMPAERYGPRTIDLDILLYGDRVVQTAVLTIPHAHLTTRATALVPLADIAANVVVPTTGRTVAEHLAELGEIEGLAPYPPGLAQPDIG